MMRSVAVGFNEILNFTETQEGTWRIEIFCLKLEQSNSRFPNFSPRLLFSFLPLVKTGLDKMFAELPYASYIIKG